MWFLDQIVAYLANVRDWFLSAYYEVYGWLYPFYLLATPLYWLYYAFHYITFYFGEFNTWLDWAAGQLAYILSWSTIQSYITSWLYYIGDLSTIFLYFWYNVTQVVKGWWADISLLIQGWIDTASSWLQSQVDNLSSLLASLQSQISYLLDQLPSINEIITWFSNWWSYILAQIISWGALTATQIWDLIDSAIRAYAPFWEGWQDWRDAVTDFFTDPEDWLYKAVDRIIERFW